MVLRAWAGVVALSFVLAGCVPSGFHTSLTPRASASDALAHTAPGSPDGEWPAPDWVARLGDPQLDALVADALRDNPDLQAARARIDIAQAQLQQFSSLTGLTGTSALSVSKARMPQSDDVANVSVQGYQVPVQLFGDPVVSPSSLFVALHYQLDLWGSNAAATRGLVSMRDAARIDAQQARLSLTVALVTLYCQLDQAYATRDLLNEKLAASEQVDAVLRERAARGIDNAYDANDATLKRNRLRAQVQLNDERLQLTELQLGALSGRGPEAGLSLKRPHLAPLADAPLPPRLSLDLMGRRPDIVAARLRVEAAYANLDSTRAQFYPDVNLAAFGGLFALTPAGLFSRKALAGSIGPAISLPIFDRARLKAKLGEDAGRADVAIALYNKTVDDALGQVAQQMTSLRSVDALLAHQAQSVDAAAKIASIAAQRHRRGLMMMRDVNLARLSLIDERMQLVELRARRRTLRVGLIGALGGGFDAGPDAAAPPTPGRRQPPAGKSRHDGADTPSTLSQQHARPNDTRLD
ncbi:MULTISPECIES: efflux transporter outer membrane subunit [Burkholderia]|uniref:efflux transporter outer membrane subunit n=1 Tax=Burkholderia TaxID=32008 RepID=UPI000A975198|nr:MULTISPECIES: efflux transporter outer membrane subunit [unclassified Burkholderia]